MHFVTPESWALLQGQDERDAAGCLVWALTNPPARRRRKGRGVRKAPLTDEQKAERDAERTARKRVYDAEWMRTKSIWAKKRAAKKSAIEAAIKHGSWLR